MRRPLPALGRSATWKRKYPAWKWHNFNWYKVKNVYGSEFRVNIKHKIEKSPFGNTCGVLRVASPTVQTAVTYSIMLTTACRYRSVATISYVHSNSGLLPGHKFQVTRGHSHLFPLKVYIIYWPVHRLHVFIKSICLLKKTWHNSEGHSMHVVLGRCRDWSTWEKVLFFQTAHRSLCIFLCGAATQRRSWPPHFEVSKSHTQRRTTVGRTPLDEWSAHRRDLYLTKHNTHNRQTSMPPVGFEPTISEGERQQTYALDRAASGTGRSLAMYACWI
jgi:hypothetical protein